MCSGRGLSTDGGGETDPPGRVARRPKERPEGADIRGRKTINWSYLRTACLTALVAVGLVAAPAPAGGISNGTTDGNSHPTVGCVVLQTPEFQGTDQFDCATGQLISPTVVLPAGHVPDFIES